MSFYYQKKICLIVPSLQGGGMERVITELANYFVKYNNDKVIIVLLSKLPHKYELCNGIEIHEPNYDFVTKYKLLYIFKTIFYLRSTIKYIKPYSILSFGELYNSFVLLSTIFLNIKIYISDRTNPDKSWGYLYEIIRKITYPKAAGIISQTEYACKIHKKRFNRNAIVIGNPIRENNGISERNEKIIVSVGRLIKTKRFDHLIHIFNDTLCDDWKLLIYGEGPNKQKLEELISLLDINNRVFLMGYSKNIENELLRASIFAFTSESEGFPNAIGEAMSAGLPVISYKFIAGAEELIVHEKTGFLIDMNDEITFKQKLLLLMKDSDLRDRFGINAKKHIKNFHGNIICQKYYNFITNAS